MTTSKTRIGMRGDPTRLLNFAVDEAVDLIARRIEDELQQEDASDEIDVAALRHQMGFTQVEFAAYFRVSVGTLRNWEQGRRKPRGAARALLRLIANKSSRGDEGVSATGIVGKPNVEISERPHQQTRYSADVHIGQRIMQRRWMLGMTRLQLGDRVGIKFQQIKKYETGSNRISASRIWDISTALEVPVSFFFEGLEGGATNAGDAQGDALTDKEAHELVRAYYAIPEEERRRLFDLARKLSDVA